MSETTFSADIIFTELPFNSNSNVVWCDEIFRRKYKNIVYHIFTILDPGGGFYHLSRIC